MDKYELAIAYFLMNLSYVDEVLNSDIRDSDKVRMCKAHMDKIKEGFPDVEYE